MIAMNDLKAQYRAIEENVKARIDGVLEHGRYILGPEVGELEGRLAEYVDVGHVISCSSGTDGLLMALMALGVDRGDAVFTTPFTFIATAEVISLLGATPVFVDIDPGTFNIDAGELEKAVRAVKANDRGLYPLPKRSASEEKDVPLKAKGIITVDLFGLPADYDSIRALAARHDLFVLEDAAQGFGGAYKGKKAGSLGDMSVTSFFPAKPLGCYGDGGAVLTDDDALSEEINSIRTHGKGTDKYDNIRVGINGRLDTIQAAVLLAKLDVFQQELAARQRVAEKYDELMSGLSGTVRTPYVPDTCRSAWAQYSILSDRRDDIMRSLKNKGVSSAVYYSKPLHLQSVFRGLGYKEGDFAVAERTSGSIVSLPMHPYLGNDDISTIVDAVAKAFS